MLRLIVTYGVPTIMPVRYITGTIQDKIQTSILDISLAEISCKQSARGAMRAFLQPERFAPCSWTVNLMAIAINNTETALCRM
jgi:hypothetical protein